MSIPAPAPIVAVRDVLSRLGFHEDWNAITDCAPSFSLKAGELEITASQVTNQYLRPEIFFGGVAFNGRFLKSIQFSMPLMVESFEQAVAWIAYGIGKEFIPFQAIDWIEDGRRWRDHLPWEQHSRKLQESAAAHRELRLARPHCFVGRDWMRMLRSKLREAASNAHANDEFLIEFDGQFLRIRSPNAIIGVAAIGPAPWPCGYVGRAAALAGLPNRLMSDPVEIGIWEGQVEIEHARLDVVPDRRTDGV